jgi:tight adherence protein C
MLDVIYESVTDGQFLLKALVLIATIAAILAAAMPLIQPDALGKRMKSVATERDRIRAREREKLNSMASKASLRQEPKAYMKGIVDQFQLSKWLGTEQAKLEMTMAGYRGPRAETTFLFFRLVTPAAMFIFGLFYVTVLSDFDLPPIAKFGIALATAYLGLKAPEIFIKNQIKKRQVSAGRAFPDAMDLMLICVESGMSIEHAFRKVAQEIGIQSVPLAEELTLTTAELSFLQDRRVAYENLGIRTGVDSIKQITTVLIQAEKYGTPLGQALRVVAQESRDHRLMAAEKKAASLPPKLTVPMIIFFLPVLFAVIMTPAIIQISNTQGLT